MTFGATLKRYRLEHNLTQANVVEQLQSDPIFHALTTISYHRWENDKVTPSVKKQANILLILDSRSELLELCKRCQRSSKFLNATIKRRWDVRHFGFDYCYDILSNESITFRTVEHLDQVPLEAKQLQHMMYDNKEKNIRLNFKAVLSQSEHNFMLLAENDDRMRGQLSFQVIKAEFLRAYFKNMQYHRIHTLHKLGIKDDEPILFLSSFHSSRKDVFVTFLKVLIENIFELPQIPKYTYLRVYGAPCNALIESQLSPTLLTKGGTEYPRVHYINSDYDWLGYLIPTHLLLLSYGSVLKQYSTLDDQKLSESPSGITDE